MKYAEMSERTKYLKESQGDIAEMCKVIEDMKKQEFAEGMEKGMEKGPFDVRVMLF